VAGTEIQTIDGEKSIEDIKVGDWVLSDDPNTPGRVIYKQVLQTFAHDATTTIDIFIDGEKITTTEEHPFWVPDVGWVAAKDLHAGTHLQTNTESWLDIDKVDKHIELTKVYNFEVEGFHTYFVSDLGFLVHNTCYTEGLKSSNPTHSVPNPSLQRNDWHSRLVEDRQASEWPILKAEIESRYQALLHQYPEPLGPFLPIPQANSPQVQKVLNPLYKGALTQNPIGNGSTAAAVRYERLTGKDVFGKP
jgi:hypothetical protein